jgi:DtxR family Mn-dependent transcriptional regulator
MIKRLAGLNMVHYEKHYGVTLTPSGEKLALEVIRHHRLIELYLKEALGFSWDEVHEQADILEHVISEKLEERIAAALNHPEFDPHGDPIPAKDGSMALVDLELLSTVTAGQSGWVRRILDDANSELLRYLAEMGLVPGTAVTVQTVAPFDGPLTLLIDNEPIVIGRAVAASVLVEITKS